MRSEPVESCRYFPTKSLELPNPLGCCELFEFNKILAVLQAEAAKTTTLPLMLYSRLSSLLT